MIMATIDFASALVGKELTWHNNDHRYCFNLEHGVVIEVGRASKNKADLLIQSDPTGNVSTVEFNAKALEELHLHGRVKLDYGMSITAADPLPDFIPEPVPDTLTVEQRTQTRRRYRLGDRVKVAYRNPSRLIEGRITAVETAQPSPKGWTTTYSITFDEDQQPFDSAGFKVAGMAKVKTEQIHFIWRMGADIERRVPEHCTIGKRVGMRIDHGDGTAAILIGTVTGYELERDGEVMILFGGYVGRADEIKPFVLQEGQVIKRDSMGEYVAA